MVKSLRDFQIGFGKYLRDPQGNSLLADIPPRRAQIYEELLFNNVSGFIDTCFPVCKNIIETSLWNRIRRQFFRDWRCQTPYFSDIPGEFLQYLQHTDILTDLPPWFFELAHYEWMELSLETMEETDFIETGSVESDSIYVRPVVRNLVYNWPVQKICKDYQPESGKQTFLIVLRSRDFKIRFLEINPATSLLINIVKKAPISRRVIADQMSQLLERENDSHFLLHCNQIIDDLLDKDVCGEYQARH